MSGTEFIHLPSGSMPNGVLLAHCVAVAQKVKKHEVLVLNRSGMYFYSTRPERLHQVSGTAVLCAKC